MKEKFDQNIGETDVERAFFGEKPLKPKVDRGAIERAESREVESTTKKLRERLQSIPEPTVSPEGQIRLTQGEYKKLNKKTDAFFEEIKDSKTATTVGYKVEAAYDSQVKGWTTRSKIMEIEGKKFFALCSYPASRTRRLFDRFMEAVSGDPMRKPKPEKWKETVESRSNIPTVAGTPDNMVVMPYVESINAYDIFAHQKDIKDFGPFDWAETLDVEDKIVMAKGLAETLKATHDTGRTWGEAILPNMILTKDKEPILIDPETTYEGIPETEQKATDVRNLISSISGALARSADMKDFSPVVKSVLAGYPDKEVREELKRICSQPQPWRQRLIFDGFSRFRIGATSLNEFEQVKKTIVEVLEQDQAR